MKNIGISLIFFALLFVASCSNDDYVEYTAPDELSDVSWVISLDKNAQNPLSVNIDTFMSFFDLSQGTVSHEWIIDEGNNFLNEGFDKTDTLSNFINEEAGLKLTTEKANVLFNNPGENNVRLYNTFNNPVSYHSSVGTLNSFKEGDLWVIDTTFTFDVYANIMPAFRVLKDSVEILKITAEDMPSLDDVNSWASVDVEAGSTLVFEDLTTIGRPNSRTWFVSEGVPNQTGGVVAPIKFFKLGSYLAGEMKSARINELPKYDVTKLIPLKINVIQSSKPFIFDGNITEDDSQVISFRVNGELKTFTGEESNFVVHVENVSSGFSQDIPVISAKVSSSDATYLDLRLSASIYNSDEVTVTYNGGNILSTDERELQPFGPEMVTMHIGRNILKSGSWASYEVAHAALNRGYAGPDGAFWVGQNNTAEDPNWSRTEERAFEGNASMKMSVEGLTKNYQLFSYGLGLIDIIPAGTYEVSYMVFQNSASNLDSFLTFGEKVPELDLVWDVSTLPKGQWVKVKKIVTLPSIDEKMKLTTVFRQEDNPNALSTRQTIYLDDFSLKIVEVRP
ncbi:hypothetical protein [Formosa sp. PL04]|uniref:hypothetical protein n=1 Tax=Formosa sp. PL04 TaxID=3081755 RepID=UPI002981145F|nr:hypothetical protein [Formosa sp. PL04]MDW5288072.1 hypothetical protein [Formosa sp. PL04]